MQLQRRRKQRKAAPLASSPRSGAGAGPPSSAAPDAEPGAGAVGTENPLLSPPPTASASGAGAATSGGPSSRIALGGEERAGSGSSSSSASTSSLSMSASRLSAVEHAQQQAQSQRALSSAGGRAPYGAHLLPGQTSLQREQQQRQHFLPSQQRSPFPAALQGSPSTAAWGWRAGEGEGGDDNYLQGVASPLHQLWHAPAGAAAVVAGDSSSPRLLPGQHPISSPSEFSAWGGDDAGGGDGGGRGSGRGHVVRGGNFTVSNPLRQQQQSSLRQQQQSPSTAAQIFTSNW